MLGTIIGLIFHWLSVGSIDVKSPVKLRKQRPRSTLRNVAEEWPPLNSFAAVVLAKQKVSPE